MSNQKIMACTFTSGADGELLSDAGVYAAEDYNNAIEIRAGGFDGSGASHNRAHFGVDSAGLLEDDLPRQNGNTFGEGSNTGDQYALVTCGTVSVGRPGIICRGNTSALGYMVFPLTDLTQRRLSRWTSPTTLTTLATATGLTTLATGDDLQIAASGSTIIGRRNGVEEISAVDATIALGTVGVYCLGDTGAAAGTYFEAGLLSSKMQSDAERANINTAKIQRRMRRPRVVALRSR